MRSKLSMKFIVTFNLLDRGFDFSGVTDTRPFCGSKRALKP